MNLKQETILQAYPFGVLLFLCCFFYTIFIPDFLSSGLFMDGLIYGTISRNMSEGLGDIWNPMMSDTQFHPFHEHPPLQIYLTSFLFKIFPDKYYLVEKGFGVFTFICSIILFVRIWLLESKEKDNKSLWLLFTFLISAPSVCYIYSRNMLEIGVTIFTLIALFLSLLSIKQKGLFRIFLLILIGTSIFLGVLCKGPTALYPLSFFFFRFLVFKEYKFFKMVIDSTVMFSVLIALVYLVSLNEQVVFYFDDYVNRMVLGAIDSDSHPMFNLKIVGKLFNELLPTLSIGFVLFLINKLVLKEKIKGDYRNASFFILLGLSASLPVILSYRQSSYYIAASYYPFAIGFTFLFHEMMKKVIFKKEWKKSINLFFCTVAIIISFFGVKLSIKNSSLIRNENERYDLKIISNLIKPHENIGSLEGGFSTVSSWQTFFYRESYLNISFDNLDKCNYLIGLKGRDYKVENFIEVNDEFKHFSLFKKVD